MSTTVIQLLTDSLRLINVIRETESPPPEMGIKSLHILNDLMADVQADGLQLGWYPIADADIATDAPLADEDVRAVKSCLALELAPFFGIEPLQQHKDNANDAYTRLAKRKVLYVESDTTFLPLGEASYPWNGWPFTNN